MVRLARIDAPFFFARARVSRDEKKSPGRLIRQLRAGSIPRRGVRRPAERNALILVRREKRTYYPRFGAASLGNGAETRFGFFFALLDPEKTSDALGRGAAARPLP